LWEKWQDLLDLNDLREWEPLTIDTGNGRSIEILADRCGYSISLTSSMGDDDETSVRDDRQIFSHAVFAKIADKGRVNLYADADRAVALSIACGEARSPLGSDLEAENEMSRNIIKMLHRFHKLGGQASDLPVLGFTFVGPVFTVYLAASTQRSSRGLVYLIQPIWSENISTDVNALAFCTILSRFGKWCIEYARPRVGAALEDCLRSYK